MAISFKCSNCGKDIKAPDSYARKQGKCPFCGQSNEIPPPETQDDDLIPLAPIDEEEEKRRQKEIEYLLSQEKRMLREMSDSTSQASPPDDSASDGDYDESKPTIEQCRADVVGYCLDLVNSDLGGLDKYIANLKRNPELGLSAVEDFMLGRYIEPALDALPPQVLKGFLAQLRQALQ